MKVHVKVCTHIKEKPYEHYFSKITKADGLVRSPKKLFVHSFALIVHLTDIFDDLLYMAGPGLALGSGAMGANEMQLTPQPGSPDGEGGAH